MHIFNSSRQSFTGTSIIYFLKIVLRNLKCWLLKSPSVLNKKPIIFLQSANKICIFLSLFIRTLTQPQNILITLALVVRRWWTGGVRSGPGGCRLRWSRVCLALEINLGYARIRHRDTHPKGHNYSCCVRNAYLFALRQEWSANVLFYSFYFSKILNFL